MEIVKAVEPPGAWIAETTGGPIGRSPCGGAIKIG